MKYDMNKFDKVKCEECTNTMYVTKDYDGKLECNNCYITNLELLEFEKQLEILKTEEETI